MSRTFFVIEKCFRVLIKLLLICVCGISFCGSYVVVILEFLFCCVVRASENCLVQFLNASKSKVVFL